jgi:hypothetical protein
MDAPSFKSFDKDSMFPASMRGGGMGNNVNISLTLEENNIAPLVVHRNKQNFGKHVYLILSNNQQFITKCNTYIRNISKYDIKEDTIDTLSEIDLTSYKKGTIYNYDNRVNAIKNENISGKFVLNFILQHIINSSEGVILVADKIEDVPNIILSMSNLVFIDKSNTNINRIIQSVAPIRIGDDYNYDLNEDLCVNKVSLWAKVTIF